MARNLVADPQYFFNRHFSWLQFNERVLEEARDENNPLLERVKFLAITASNLDEFVEVRVAGMLQQVEHGNRELGPDGRMPAEVLAELGDQDSRVREIAVRLLAGRTASGAGCGIDSRCQPERSGPGGARAHRKFLRESRRTALNAGHSGSRRIRFPTC